MEPRRPAGSDATDETARLLQEAHTFIQSLPPQERRIATLAAKGAPVWEIAQEARISDEAVARVIDRIVAALRGRDIEPVETGGLGADTDPGVTGGYDPEPPGGAER